MKPFVVLVESDVIVSIRASEMTLLLAARMPNDFNFSVFEISTSPTIVAFTKKVQRKCIGNWFGTQSKVKFGTVVIFSVY